MIAFLLLAMQLSILERIEFKNLWNRFGLPGILFGIIWLFGSDTGQRAFNIGAIIACI